MGRGSPYDNFQYSEADQLFHIDGDLETPGLSLSDITGGRFNLAGTAVRDSTTGRIVTNLALSDDTTVTRVGYTDNLGDFHSSVTFSRPTLDQSVNTAIPSTAYYSADVSVDVQIPGGELFTVEGANIGLNAHGSALYIREGGQLGKGDFFDVPIDPTTGAPEIIPPSGFRKATPDEAIRYGIGSFVLDRYYDQLTRMVLAGATDEDGNPFVDAYDLAYNLATRIQANYRLSSVFSL